MELKEKIIKIEGTEKYIEKNTGREKEMAVIHIEEENTNFLKMWHYYIIHSLGIIGKQKIAFVFWFFEQANDNGEVLMTFRQMSEKSGTSLFTVTTVIKQLIQKRILSKINTGVYRLAPGITEKNVNGTEFDVLIRFEDQNSKICEG